jgi:hypothetical protein
MQCVLLQMHASNVLQGNSVCLCYPFSSYHYRSMGALQKLDAAAAGQLHRDLAAHEVHECAGSVNISST